MRNTSVVLALAFLCNLSPAVTCVAADDEVKTAEKRDTLLYVRTVPPGAKILLDGKELGTSDNVFPVEPGVATVLVELEGHKPNAKQVAIRANGVTRVVLDLKPQGETSAQVIKEAVITISHCAEGDPNVLQSMKSLRPLDQSQVVKGLLPYLDSPEETIRRSAIYILWKGKFADIEPTVPTLEKLLTHEEMFTRGMAALALGQNRVASSYNALVKMTTSDSTGYARRCAAIALGWLGDKRAESVLQTAMKDSDPLVCTNAAVALGLLGDKQAESILEAALKDSNPQVCKNARIALDILHNKARTTGKNNATPHEHAEAEKKAAESAEAWLALVDRGQYEQSWDAATEFFKNAVGKNDFAKSLNGVRKPLGNLKSRKVMSKQYATKLPGAPDGEYVILQYTSSFANKESATETVTPMLDKDKTWRVSGYYIK